MRNIVVITSIRNDLKFIKDKNIRLIKGKPLLAYTIEQTL